MKVNADELLADVRAVAADEWEQAMAAGRVLQEVARLRSAKTDG
jgi:hypothetical protein